MRFFTLEYIERLHLPCMGSRRFKDDWVCAILFGMIALAAPVAIAATAALASAGTAEARDISEAITRLLISGIINLQIALEEPDLSSAHIRSA